MTQAHATILRGSQPPRRVDLHSRCVGLTGVCHASKSLATAGALTAREFNALTGTLLYSVGAYERANRLAAAAMSLAEVATRESNSRFMSARAADRYWLGVVLSAREGHRRTCARPLLRAAVHSAANPGDKPPACDFISDVASRVTARLSHTDDSPRHPHTLPADALLHAPMAAIVPRSCVIDSAMGPELQRQSPLPHHRDLGGGQLASSLVLPSASVFRVSRR